MSVPPAFGELVAATNFSFLHGASHGPDMVGRAMELAYPGLGIADRNTVAGVVRAWQALKQAREKAAAAEQSFPDFKLVTGARLVFADGTPDIVVYPEDRRGWAQLCQLLSTGNLRADKGDCVLGFDDLLAFQRGLLLIVLPESSRRDGEGVEGRTTILPPPDDAPPSSLLAFPATPRQRPEPSASGAAATIVALPRRKSRGVLVETLATLRRVAGNRVWLGVAPHFDGRDRRRLVRWSRMAAQVDVPLIATNDALHARREDRPLQDVLTCIRLGVTVAAAGKALAANGERHLKSGEEMAALFVDHPRAIEEIGNLLDRIGFDLEQLKYEYPHEPVPKGWTPIQWLRRMVGRAAGKRWPKGIPDKTHAMLREEFDLIHRHNIAYYFLTVHDIVRYARSRPDPILCQGRGSAANSMVCFLLGVTAVDPAEHNLLFSRFLSDERKEPPDIDVDFEHERREEVMQYVYRRYGRHRAGIVATVIHYRSRSAVREVGKALGLTEDVTSRLVSTVWGSYSTEMAEDRFHETGFSLDNPEIARLNHFVGLLLKAPFPRHLSQHVGGFVLTEGRLDETVPIHHAAMEDRTFIEWDKDDIDALGLMKVDVLALGMLTCIRKAFAMIRNAGGPAYQLDTVPVEEPVYDMLCEGDSIGVFQVESRAQMNMLPRLRPRKFYDLVVQVAIVRPGPIQGDMVHPYLRRRMGLEPVDFPSPAKPHPPDELKQLLGKTYGVPLFQEQAMKLAIVAAGFTPVQANKLRRSMATFRNVGGMHNFRKELVGGMVARGYQAEFAERCYRQIEGFGSYGFPESHAIAFARLVYVSAYLKCRYPAAFCAALLNSQPMGFYAPAQIVGCARDHGVKVLPIDVAESDWDNRCEAGEAVRLGFRQIDGFREDWAAKLGRAPRRPTLDALARMLPSRALRLLADADAMRALGLDRRQALWAVRRAAPKALPLFAAMEAPELGEEADPHLPEMPDSEHVAADYQTARLSLKGHPMQFLRETFDREGVKSAAAIAATPNGRRAKAAGVVLVRQRPGEGKAIFVTLEDETGVVNALLWARDFERYRMAVMASRLMEVRGIVQREGKVVHLMTTEVVDRTAELSRLSEEHQCRQPLARADVFEHPVYTPPNSGGRRHPRDVRILPASRDFH